MALGKIENIQKREILSYRREISRKGRGHSRKQGETSRLGRGHSHQRREISRKGLRHPREKREYSPLKPCS